MPPCQPAQLEAVSACNFNVMLPDDVAVKVFSFLELEERHAAVPLVCHRWRRLAHSPELLRTLHAEVLGKQVLPRVRSLACWLQTRAAGQARCLRLQLDPPCGGANTAPTPLAAGQDPSAACTDDDEASQALAALTTSLAACGSQGLRAAHLDMDYLPLSLGSWATAALRSVRRLHVGVFEAKLTVDAPLQALTQLEELSLEGAPLWLEPAACLPPALTRLHLGGCSSGRLVEKEAQLGGTLKSLSLARMEHTSESLGLLTTLGSLQRLSISWCSHLPMPAALAQLHGLRALHIDHTPRRGRSQEVCAELQAALEPLTQLQHLVCAHVRAASQVPVALADMAQLQRFCWHGPAPQEPALPSGPWLASLRQLVVPADVAAASLAVLSGATGLEALGLSRFACGGSQGQYAILRWAAQHPSLARLGMHLRDAQLPVGLFDAAVEAQRRKPTLCIQRNDAIGEELRKCDM